MKDILRGAVLVGLFLVPFLTLYVANGFFFPFITGKNFAFRIIVEIVVALWVVLACYDRQYRPRFSWILAAFGSLMVVMLVANLLAVHPATALWSNFERMDGYVTLIHVFGYFVVLGTMLQTPKIWSYFFHTSLVVAGFVALKGLSQLSASTGGVRVDSTLGNAAYMAVYMLFHIFILAYLFVQTKVTPYRIVYVLLGILFIFVLFQTGTRGTVIGLAVGSIVAVGYIAIFATRHKQLRTYAVASLLLLTVLIGGFVAARDTAYIQNSNALSRIANIDLGSDLVVRSQIWSMALAGVKERPVLGWGQGNFNYVFNAEYKPSLYGQEQWFDRTHNIFFDWLIAGGIVGFIAYFSIFGAILYYLVIRPLRRLGEPLSVLERAVLLGLFAGYLTHNLVVFDNIVSYIFFAAFLALLHSKVSVEFPKLASLKIPESIVTQIVLPVMLIIGAATVYVVNVPGILAAGDIIVAFQNPNISERLDSFKLALSRGSFGEQEITEQLAQQAMSVVASKDPAVTEELKTAYTTLAESELLKMVEKKPGDARLHVFLASYYRAIGNLEKAKVQMNRARELSPNKQAIILQQGAIELSLGNNEVGRDFFKTAYELDTSNTEAREYYVASLFYSGDIDDAIKMISEADESFKLRLSKSDFVLGAINSAKEFDLLTELYELRVQNDPSNAQNWASLAFLYHELKNKDKAVDTLERASIAVPTFAPMAQCISANLTAEREPQVGCQ